MISRISLLPIPRKAAFIFLIMLFVLSACDNSGSDNNESAKEYTEQKETLIRKTAEGYSEFRLYINSMLQAKPENIETISFMLSAVQPPALFLKKMAKDSSPKIRAVAAKVIGLQQKPAFLQSLLLLLYDDNKEVSRAAVEALAVMDLKQAAEALIKEMQVSDGTARNSLNARYALARSRYYNASDFLATTLIENWQKEYLSPRFIMGIQALRHLRKDNEAFKDELYAGEGKSTLEVASLLGLYGDAARLIYVIDNEIDVNRLYYTDRKLLERVVDALSIQTERNAVTTLYKLSHIASTSKRTSKLKQLFEQGIKNSFKFHSYLILNGKDDFKIKALNSFLIFGLNDYREECLGVLRNLQSEKVRNFLVANQMITVMGTLQQAVKK